MHVEWLEGSKVNKIGFPLMLIASAVEPVQSARIAAMITTEGGLSFIGTNKRKTHPLQSKFKDRDTRLYLHAEIDSLSKLVQFHRKRREAIPRFKIILARVIRAPNKRGFISAIVTPCNGCVAALEHFGCIGVYSLQEGLPL